MNSEPRKAKKKQRAKARKPRRRTADARAAAPTEAPDGPITAFTEHVSSIWPTPDSLDDAAAGAGQRGVENIDEDARGPSGRSGAATRKR
jgi:hypothetical protein